MNLKLTNHGQFKLHPVPPWKRNIGTPAEPQAQLVRAILKAFNKPELQYRCVVQGKTISAGSEEALRRQVGAALRDQVKKDFSRILAGNPYIKFRP